MLADDGGRLRAEVLQALAARQEVYNENAPGHSVLKQGLVISQHEVPRRKH